MPATDLRRAGDIPLLLVPGWRNSGPDHWQSRWHRARPQWQRVDFREWDAPDPRAWRAVLHQAVMACSQPPLLIAHSLGCLATASMMALPSPPAIAGAMLVAPPDPGRWNAPPALADFAPPALQPFGVPGLVVISSTDTFADETYGVHLARSWGLAAELIGASGHINAESGHGDWPEGLVLLERLMREVSG